MNPTTQISLLQSLVTVKAILKQFVNQPNFQSQLELAFGDEFDANIALGIAASIKANDFSQILPNSELITNNFDAINSQSLIDDESLTQNLSRPELIVNLLLQEVGRKFDLLLNGTVDSSNDEGAVFAAIAQSAAISDTAFEQPPVSDDSISSKIHIQPASIARPIWNDADLYPDSYITTDDTNPVSESEVTAIETEQSFQILPAIWYNPELDSNIQDTVVVDESYTTIEYGNPIIEGEVIAIEGEQPIVIGKPFWYDPEADISTPEDESYTTIEYGNPIIEGEVIAIEGEQPIVIGKPFWYDPEADLSDDDTIPEDESYTDSIEGSATKRIMQGSNIEGIDVPKFDESDSTFTDEDINVSQDFYCVLPVFDLEYIVDESGYTGGNTFIFGAEDISMNTAQALLLATPITLEFTTGLDKLLLSQSTFNSIYTNADGGISSFANVADDSFVDLNDAEIVYSQSTGKLFYNQNGAKTGLGDSGGQFATLSGSSTLSAGDFGILLEPSV